MPCYRPITAYRSSQGRNANGAWPLSFSVNGGFKDMPVTIACGKCIGCRLERSKEWASRCVHESRLWDSNLFLTLTYDDAHLPKNMSLVSKHLQDFWKRLRSWVFSPTGLGRVPEKEFVDGANRVVNGIRYFACGEYGDTSKRPHYHAIVFNLDLPDKIPYKRSFDGSQLYISNTLNALWGHGYCVIGAVTFQSCAYVARYVTKKIYGLSAPEHYGDREPEFCRSSNRPGIGANWFIKYADEVARNGFVLINGHKNPVPRYYLKRLERLDPQKLLDIKEHKRIIATRKQDNPDKSYERLADREALQEYRARQLRRDKATH